MNIKNPMSLALTAGLLAMLSPCFAHAERGRDHRPPPLERVLEKHAEELGLGEDVLSQVKELSEGRRETMTPFHEALKGARTELRELIESSTSTDEQILAQVGAVSAAENTLHLQKTRGMLDVRALLTEEQLQKLAELRPERGQQGEGRGRGQGKCRKQGGRSEGGRGQRDRGRQDGTQEGVAQQ